MSLTKEQIKNTREEFQKNIKLSGLSLTQIALDLHTDVSTLKNIIDLNTTSIENPWILKNYLNNKIKNLNKTPIPFSALIGDYHNYWFLDSIKIDEGKILR